MRSLRVALVLPFVCTIGACAAIFNGTRQNIPVQSTPSGAMVATNPIAGTATTPATLILPRKDSYVLTFTAEGYAPATFNLTNQMQVGYVVADVLLTGLIGVVVDAVTGAWYALHPETATVSLVKAAKMGMMGPDTIRVEIGNGPKGRLVLKSDVPVHVEVTRIP